MKNLNKSITIIGAGLYGTALAIRLSQNNRSVFLWGYNKKHQIQLEKNRFHSGFIPKIKFPNKLFLIQDLSFAVRSSHNILIVVPSRVFKNILYKIKPFLDKNSRILWATKGLEKKTGRFLKDVVHEIIGKKIPLAIISGPTFAKELANGLPTAISLAVTDKRFSQDLQELLHCKNTLRIYKNSDFIGVQLGGVVKNVIAIGSGISDGMGFGSNARTALITRGLTEMTRLGYALGAKISTFMGMAGLGDLILTCTDNQSRNRRFGILLGKGIDVETAKIYFGEIIEGYHNTKEVRNLAKSYSVEMPITEQIYQVLYCNKKVCDAAKTLLNRTQKDENWFSFHNE